MYALLVQHGAFYGVSVRLINDATADALRGKMVAQGGRHEGAVTYLETHTPGNPEDDATAWLMQVQEPDMTFGFDTGKYDEGFKIIDDLLKDV